MQIVTILRQRRGSTRSVQACTQLSMAAGYKLKRCALATLYQTRRSSGDTIRATQMYLQIYKNLKPGGAEVSHRK